jgi:hypothetical protein
LRYNQINNLAHHFERRMSICTADFLSNWTIIIPHIVNNVSRNAEHFDILQRFSFDTLPLNGDKRPPHQFGKLKFTGDTYQNDTSLLHFQRQIENDIAPVSLYNPTVSANIARRRDSQPLLDVVIRRGWE